jgi:hypothetical protein
MQASNSVLEFMNCGSVITKLSSTSANKNKYLWATKDELRWSNCFEDQNSYSKINLDQIISVKPHDKLSISALVIETTRKTYKFSFRAFQIREKWYKGIQQLMSATFANSKLLKTKSKVLGENNKGSEAPETSKETLEKLLGILKQYSQSYDLKIDWDQDDYYNIPTYLEDVLFTFQAKKWEQDASKKNEENDPKRLASKISMLRKRIKMLDIEKNTSAEFENLSFLIEKEKQQNAYLQNKIEEGVLEKNKAFHDCYAIKSELDKAKELKTHLEADPCKNILTNVTETLKSVLQKGFICYICTLNGPELPERLILTPRRGYEDGVYKKRQLRLSGDYGSLVWKAVGLFTKKFITLNINDISTVIDGTEDPDRYEPFPAHKYISLVTKGLTVMICIENHYGIYLDGIKDLYMLSNGLGVPEYDIKPSYILKLASEQLQNQIFLYTRLYNRYKNSLIDSICIKNTENFEYQDTLYEEIKHLKALNDSLPIGIMASDSENYLRTEKKILKDRINALISLKSCLS